MHVSAAIQAVGCGLGRGRLLDLYSRAGLGSDTKTKLSLGFGGSVELLVDRGVCAVQGDKRRRAIRVALKDGILTVGKLQQSPKLDS